MASKSIIFLGLDRLLQIPFAYHLILGFGCRLLLIIYGCYHDATFLVKYTDIDYRVFTDAARHVMKGESPYDRHTYRYSPLIAWLLLPNVFLHETFGKVLFSVADIMISICIKSYIFRQQNSTPKAAKVAKYCSFFWLYNPFSIAISTRGNADSVSCLFIMLSIYFLQTKITRSNDTQYFLSGIFLGVAIHLRLYPLVFTVPMYLSLGKYTINHDTSLAKGLLSLIPNRKQIILTVTTIIYFVACTYGMYLIYGYKFIFESYIYHLFRNDTRHNFSLFFYYSYLRMNDMSFDLVKFSCVLFECVILLFISLSFGNNPRTLPFALFCQACVLVIFNTVVTSQYFIWYLSLLPLVVHNIQGTAWEAVTIFMTWIFSQVTWLFFAFHLEFLGQNVFILIWSASVVFFFSNIMLLYQIIMKYDPFKTLNVAYTDVAAKNK